MKLYNSLTKTTDDFKPLKDEVTVYTCGPTVYNNLHIGNLSSFIYADTLRRALKLQYSVRQVMNITDIDDKTIRDSKIDYPEEQPMEALKKLTSKYRKVFVDDMKTIGNDLSQIELIDATDYISDMQKLIIKLIDADIAYIAEDGVYFDIKAYQAAGKKYGQLFKIDLKKMVSRITDDEYADDTCADFALWKTQCDGEPAWPFDVNGSDLTGRPGWHIECSAMSEATLGLPFDIHTGGVDLKFPHHENEIAQSTALGDDTMAGLFFHNEHLLVDGAKMSKSKHNFYTLRDIESKGIDPLAFRLLVLQSHYKNQLHFSWETLNSAANRLKVLKKLAVLRFQTDQTAPSYAKLIESVSSSVDQAVTSNLHTPMALAALAKIDILLTTGLATKDKTAFNRLFKQVDDILALDLTATKDISKTNKDLLKDRSKARSEGDYVKSDEIRNKLSNAGIEVKDVKDQQIWSYN